MWHLLALPRVALKLRSKLPAAKLSISLLYLTILLPLIPCRPALPSLSIKKKRNEHLRVLSFLEPHCAVCGVRDCHWLQLCCYYVVVVVVYALTDTSEKANLEIRIPTHLTDTDADADTHDRTPATHTPPSQHARTHTSILARKIRSNTAGLSLYSWGQTIRFPAKLRIFFFSFKD